MSYFKNSKNAASFIGNLGKDAETKTLESGQSVTKFSLATTQVVGKDDKKAENTIWIPCTLWGNEKLVPFLKKGRQVAIEAFYSTSTSGEGADKKYFHEFVVTDIVLLAEGKENAQ